MVDVSQKPATTRRAIAEAFVRLTDEHLKAMDSLPKGDALAVAKIAGISAAKKTYDLIPLCHPLPLTFVGVEIERTEGGLKITGEAKTDAPTGVEVEALMAVTVAALTIYDMVKAIGQEITIEGVRLVEKTGGKSDWKRNP